MKKTLENLSGKKIIRAFLTANKLDLSKPVQEEEQSVINVLKEKAHKKLNLADFKYIKFLIRKEFKDCDINFVPEELKLFYDDLICFNNFYYSAVTSQSESLLEYTPLNLIDWLRDWLGDYKATRRRTRAFEQNSFEFKVCESFCNSIVSLALYGGYTLVNTFDSVGIFAAYSGFMSMASVWFVSEVMVPWIEILCTSYSKNQFYRITKTEQELYFDRECPKYFGISYDEQADISTVKFNRYESKDILDDTHETFKIPGTVEKCFRSEDLWCLNYITVENEFRCYDLKTEKHIKLPQNYLIYAALDQTTYILLKIEGNFENFFQNTSRNSHDIHYFFGDKLWLDRYTYGENDIRPHICEIVFAREYNGEIVQIKPLIAYEKNILANILFSRDARRLVIIETKGKIRDYNPHLTHL